MHAVPVLYLLSVICFIDTDECEADENPCGDNAECKNVKGSFNCTCLEGFEMAEGEKNKCVDIDECEEEGAYRDICCIGFKKYEHKFVHNKKIKNETDKEI